MNKKGQAALEFLTTYGWAFLVILVMIGALAYFGVLDPTRYLPQRCQFGAEMHCEKFALDSAGTANFELSNALPSHVFIAAMEWKTPDTDIWKICQTVATVGGGDVDVAVINDGLLTDGVAFNRETSQDFVCTDTNDDGAGDDEITEVLVAGDKNRVQFRLSYNEGTGQDVNYIKYIYGEIYANVK